MSAEPRYRASTIGELRTSGYRVRPVKEELRANLVTKLKRREPLFPGIIGYDQTVIPEVENAILAKHDLILLGLRGQAKTRILRSLVNLLDDAVPVIKGCEINDNPYHPICQSCTDRVREQGEAVEIEWLERERRYGEKLATPDVTIADLIGDIDPIKAASQRLHYSHEGVIHFGIIPRMNRGIFAINELPDLQPRIQVGLLNIMEEKDIQIRGFPVRIPLDVLIVFSANPEDYTNRGSIITPLKDRIASQILTHYPRTLEDAIAITTQEAWIERDGWCRVELPHYFREIIEEIAFQARKSEFIDQKSGVSTRLPVSCMENLISNVEKRGLLSEEPVMFPRICDLAALIPSTTGKLELVYEGEQEGAMKVATVLIGRAVKEVFKKYFPDAYQAKGTASQEKSYYQEILDWFENGNRVDVSDRMSGDDYFTALDRVKGLRRLATRHINVETKAELASVMELILEGLHQNSRLSKRGVDGLTSYSDMMGSIFEK